MFTFQEKSTHVVTIVIVVKVAYLATFESQAPPSATTHINSYMGWVLRVFIPFNLSKCFENIFLDLVSSSKSFFITLMHGVY